MTPRGRVRAAHPLRRAAFTWTTATLTAGMTRTPQSSPEQDKSGSPTKRGFAKSLAMITWTSPPLRGQDSLVRFEFLMSRSVDLCGRSLPLAGLRRVALNGWNGGCSGHLFGFGVGAVPGPGTLRCGRPVPAEGGEAAGKPSVQVFPVPRRGWGAVGLLAGPEPIREAFLLEEEPEHAGRGQRGGLLVRARLAQAAQQSGHAVRAVEGGVPGGIGFTMRSFHLDNRNIDRRNDATPQNSPELIAAEPSHSMSCGYCLTGPRVIW